MFIGDQADRKVLRDLRDRLPKIDILIDDDGHIMAQQINTFEQMFPCVKNDGPA